MASPPTIRISKRHQSDFDAGLGWTGISILTWLRNVWFFNPTNRHGLKLQNLFRVFLVNCEAFPRLFWRWSSQSWWWIPKSDLQSIQWQTILSVSDNLSENALWANGQPWLGNPVGPGCMQCYVCVFWSHGAIKAVSNTPRRRWSLYCCIYIYPGCREASDFECSAEGAAIQTYPEEPCGITPRGRPKKIPLQCKVPPLLPRWGYGWIDETFGCCCTQRYTNGNENSYSMVATFEFMDSRTRSLVQPKCIAWSPDRWMHRAMRKKLWLDGEGMGSVENYSQRYQQTYFISWSNHKLSYILPHICGASLYI